MTDPFGSEFFPTEPESDPFFQAEIRRRVEREPGMTAERYGEILAGMLEPPSSAISTKDLRRSIGELARRIFLSSRPASMSELGQGEGREAAEPLPSSATVQLALNLLQLIAEDPLVRSSHRAAAMRHLNKLIDQGALDAAG